MKLTDLLLKEAVFPHVAARDKKQALKQMSVLSSAITGIEGKEIFAALTEREQHGSTCMGSGVCIPRARFPELGRPYAFFSRFDQPVEFDGQDGKPVDLMFMLLSPEDAQADHVKSLALLSKLLRNKTVCNKLRQADDADAMYELLEAASHDEAA